MIHQLPRTPETPSLRVLGRGKVQTQAIEELEVLSPDNPWRANALILLNRLKAHLETNLNPNIVLPHQLLENPHHVGLRYRSTQPTGLSILLQCCVESPIPLWVGNFNS
ncbi:hypothetical protein [Spirulina subsalsa]|uniref:hypothetical protein n=1 Tax=Spirulina subsalsa TaxID=54311 RepID=UPI0022375F44|nr:hypothetical protein [Spirulina subsalsa]